MPETIDPYATLGVPRTATRAEVGRAYRALAKRWHPDTAATQSERELHAASMARLNQAWNILSNDARRERWDAAHPHGALPRWAREPIARESATRDAYGMPAWRPPIVERVVEVPAPQRSIRDSGWLAIGVVLIAGAVVSGALAAITSQPVGRLPVEELVAGFSGEGLVLNHPPEWSAFAGGGDRRADAAVVVHLISDPTVDPAEACTNSEVACNLAVEELDAGDVSLVITRWRGGPPPVPDPESDLAEGISADMLGDVPVAFRSERHAGGTAAWWQLSPPDFPDRWFEAYAWIPGSESQVDQAVANIEAVLSTVEFRN